MIYLRFPNFEKFSKQYDALKIQSYRVYSSLFELTPKASFTYSADYVMPDMLNFFVGSAFPIQWCSGTGAPADNFEDSLSDPVDLSNMFIKTVKCSNSEGGNLTTVTLVGEFEFFQNSKIRKAYTNKYGNEVVEDVIASNAVMNHYNLDIQKTDNVSTLYRTLGESDEDFVYKKALELYTLNAGKPLFYTGLDKIIHYTSLNNLTEATDKSKILIKLPGLATDNGSADFLANTIQNYVDEDDYVELEAADYDLNVGGAATVNLKNRAYSTSFSNGNVLTTSFTYEPALKGKSVFPVDKVFMLAAEATQALAVYNRPDASASFELKNYFDRFEDLITFKIKVTTIDPLQNLILAGDTIVIITPYVYSAYNGKYIVTEIEYGLDQGVSFMELKAVRATLDLVWVDGLKQDKESNDFKIPFAPTLQKNTLYTL